MKKLTLVSLGFLLLVYATGIFAGDATTMLFDRGLPTANLNNAAGSNRSNVAWADFETSIDPRTGYPMEYWVPGDDFTISQPGKYQIKTIRVWVVGAVPSDNGGKSHATLWGGTVSKGIDRISHKYTVTPVTYSNGQVYQGSSGGFTQINQIDFDVDFELQGGETFTFFVDEPYVPYPGGYVNAFLHASNRKLSGSSQDGADDWFLYLHSNAGTLESVDTWNSETGEGTLCPPDIPCPGWDKSSDANVQVFGRKGHEKD